MPMRLFRKTVPILLSTSLFLGCGDDGPTGPGTSNLELVALRGDDQFGEPGTLLPIPLEVRVQSLSDGEGAEGVRVRWELMEGLGAELEAETTVTDSAGFTSTRLTLGSDLGFYRVRASVKGMLSGPVEFRARAIRTPELTLVPTDPAPAGDTIRLGGKNFSSNPWENIVTFSGVRGLVTAASATTLDVEVPPCLPTRWVDVGVRIGSLATPTSLMPVEAGGQFLSLPPGADTILDASEGLSCVRLPSEQGARYLAVPHTTGTVGGAYYDFSLVGLTRALQLKTPRSPSRGPVGTTELVQKAGPQEAGELQRAWDGRVRSLETELLKERNLGEGVRTVPRFPGGGLASGAVPQLGDTRQFNVLNAENEFDKVTARVVHITDHALLYMDQEAPEAGFLLTDLASMADQFENPIYPTVTGFFGSESDLDGNGRVVILFTPAVNRLTPEGSDGYVGGFFFGLDLLEGRSGSNEGEIFYAVVPDPQGIHGPPLARTTLIYSVPSILAHEFEHMVHFNQRILEEGAESQDALWLSEALAQMAEDLVGDAYRRLGDWEMGEQYQKGNWNRARRFLLEPSQVSVLATLPPGTLAERGAGWLLLKYLWGQDDGGHLLRSLTSSSLTGVANVTQVVGRPWEEIISDWAGAMYLDGLAVSVRQDLRFLGFDIRSALSVFDGLYPLRPVVRGDQTFFVSGTLWSSAPDYHIITTPGEGGIALNLSGSEGAPAHPASGLRLLLVRLD